MLLKLLPNYMYITLCDIVLKVIQVVDFGESRKCAASTLQ